MLDSNVLVGKLKDLDKEVDTEIKDTIDEKILEVLQRIKNSINEKFGTILEK